MTMNRLEHGRAPRVLPVGGQVAYFVQLHLETAQEREKHPHLQRVRVYSVDGKARPMLVLTQLSKPARGRRWFLVLPITSKGQDARGRTRTDVQRIGNCLDPERPSFVKLEPVRLPDNLLSSGCGQTPVVQPCDPQAFGNAVKVLMHCVLRGSVGKVFGLET